eukprot:6109426-Alexandrium_andersonii.AAC.1
MTSLKDQLQKTISEFGNVVQSFVLGCQRGDLVSMHSEKTVSAALQGFTDQVKPELKALQDFVEKLTDMHAIHSRV